MILVDFQQGFPDLRNGYSGNLKGCNFGLRENRCEVRWSRRLPGDQDERWFAVPRKVMTSVQGPDLHFSKLVLKRPVDFCPGRQRTVAGRCSRSPAALAVNAVEIANLPVRRKEINAE